MARAGDDSLEDLFKAFPALLGRSATPAERKAFGRYADLLILWNQTHHLTALRSRAAVGRGLFLDSLLFRALIPPGPNRVVDIGAGAGIPGVPLRLVEPGLSLTLVESKRKPISFLHALVRELGIPDTSVRHGRAEQIILEVPELVGQFDIVLTRAVGLDAQLMDTAMLYLRLGGRLLASGPPAGTRPRSLDWSGTFEWKTIQFAKIGSTRTFLEATKAG